MPEAGSEENGETECDGPGALLRDTIAQEDVTTDDASGHDLKGLAKEAGLEEVMGDQGSLLTTFDNPIRIDSLNWEQALKVTLKHMLSGETPNLSSSKEEMNETEEEAPDELAKDVAADNANHHDLKELFNKFSLEVINETKEEAPAELLKEATADDTNGRGLVELAKEAGLEEVMSDQESQLTDSDTYIKTDLLNWKQVEGCRGTARALDTDCPRADTGCDPELEDGEDPELPQQLYKEDVTADNDTGQGLEEKNEIKDEAPDELLKGVTADNAPGHNLKRLAKEAGLEEGDETAKVFLLPRSSLLRSKNCPPQPKFSNL